jgi:hypothetical protein
MDAAAGREGAVLEVWRVRIGRARAQPLPDAAPRLFS